MKKVRTVPYPIFRSPPSHHCGAVRAESRSDAYLVVKNFWAHSSTPGTTGV